MGVLQPNPCAANSYWYIYIYVFSYNYIYLVYKYNVGMAIADVAKSTNVAAPSVCHVNI